MSGALAMQQNTPKPTLRYMNLSELAAYAVLTTQHLLKKLAVEVGDGLPS